MASEEFLSCLSRGALEAAARAEGVNIAPRAKDTRARIITRFKDGTYHHPDALFRLTPAEQTGMATGGDGDETDPFAVDAGGDDDSLTDDPMVREAA
jgi:ParB family chromosome partitioning protein